MVYDGVVEDVRKAIALEKPKKLPIFACSEEFDVKWHGKYTYEELCQDGAKMAEVWIAAIEAFDYDWAWMQVDDCFEFEPLGVKTHGEGNILRATNGYLPATKETLAGLKIPNPKTDGRMPEKLDAIRRVKEHFGDTVLIVGSCAAPFSSAGLLYGMEEAMILALTEPNLLAETCDFFVEMQTEYIKHQVEAGAHAVWIGDCNAFSSMLSIEQYRTFALPPSQKLVKNVQALGAMVYIMNSEILTPYLLAECDLGADIINCGPESDLPDVRRALTGKNCFSGNVDPIETLLRGTPQQVAEETERAIRTGYSGGGYLFNTGEMVPRDVPEENMRAMMETARKCRESLA